MGCCGAGVSPWMETFSLFSPDWMSRAPHRSVGSTPSMAYGFMLESIMYVPVGALFLNVHSY